MSAGFKERQHKVEESDTAYSEPTPPKPGSANPLPHSNLQQPPHIREESERMLVGESYRQKMERVKALFNVTQSAVRATQSRCNGPDVGRAVPGQVPRAENVKCDPPYALSKVTQSIRPQTEKAKRRARKEARIRALLYSSGSEEEWPMEGNGGDKIKSRPDTNTENTTFVYTDCCDEDTLSDNPPVRKYIFFFFL